MLSRASPAVPLFLIFVHTAYPLAADPRILEAKHSIALHAGACANLAMPLPVLVQLYVRIELKTKPFSIHSPVVESRSFRTTRSFLCFYFLLSLIAMCCTYSMLTISPLSNFYMYNIQRIAPRCFLL